VMGMDIVQSLASTVTNFLGSAASMGASKYGVPMTPKTPTQGGPQPQQQQTRPPPDAAYSHAASIDSLVQQLNNFIDPKGQLISTPGKDTKEGAIYVKSMFSQKPKDIQPTAIGTEAINICKEGEQITDEIVKLATNPNPDGTEIRKRIDALSARSISFRSQADFQNQNIPANNIPASFSQTPPAGGSAGQNAVANAKYKTEVAQKLLESQKQDLKEAEKKKEESSRRLAELLSEMKSIDLKNINFADIIKVLKKALFFSSSVERRMGQNGSIFP